MAALATTQRAYAAPVLSEDELMHLYIAANAPVLALDLVDPERRPVFEALRDKRLLEPVRLRRCGVEGVPHGLSREGARVAREVWGIGQAPDAADMNGLTRGEADAMDVLRALSWQSEALFAARLRPSLPLLARRGLAELRRPAGEPARLRLRVIEAAW